MKTLNLLMVICFILFLLVMPVSAWTDNFNDEDISNWDIISGAPTTHATGGLDGTPSLYLEDDSLSYSFDNGYYTDISFYYRQPTGTGTAPFPYSIITFFDDDVTTYYVKIESYHHPTTKYNAVFTIPSTTYSYTARTAFVHPYYKFKIDVNSNTLFADVTIYYVNGTIVNTQNIDFSAIYQTTNKFTINTNGGADDVYAYVDNVEVSGLEGSPYAESGINWDEEEYIEGDTASYTWSLENSWWVDLIYKYQVLIEKDGTEVSTAKVSQTGTRYFEVNNAGSYTVKLQYSGLWPTSWQNIDSDTVNVIPEVDSYINVPQTAYTAEPFAISYLYGRTPLGPFLKISKQIPSETGDYTYVNVDADYLKDQNIVAGIVYTPNLTIFESGTYLIGIYDINLLTESSSMLIASDTIRIFYQDAISRINITESKIDTSNTTTIGLGDTLFGNYQVDSLNYTTGPIRLEMYNYENDVISFSMPKQAQKGSYELPIKNLEYFVEVKDGHETVYKVDALFYTGNNQVRLARYDPDGTYNQTLAFTNVTIDYVNSAGYSLTLSKYMVVQNEPFTISVKCPTTSRLVIFDDTGYVIDTINLSGNVNIPYSLSSKGKYSIQLYDPSTNLQCIELITVNEGFRPDVVVEEEPTQTTIDMVITFLSMPAFWGMIIWVGVVGGSAQKVSGNATGYIAFLFANILAVIGLFAPYTIYIVLITWIAAGIFFKLGRDATGGE